MAAEPIADGPPLQVLIVEDNPHSAWTMERLVQRFGHATSVVGDGVTALQKIKQTQPDVVLLDIGLPGLDGSWVASRAREQQLPKQLFLIAVTAYCSEADRAKSQEAGINVHLCKPVDVKDLHDLLADCKQQVKGFGTPLA